MDIIFNQGKKDYQVYYKRNNKSFIACKDIRAKDYGPDVSLVVEPVTTTDFYTGLEKKETLPNISINIPNPSEYNQGMQQMINQMIGEVIYSYMEMNKHNPHEPLRVCINKNIAVVQPQLHIDYTNARIKKLGDSNEN